MNQKKYKARLSGLVAAAMLGTSVLPVWATQADTTLPLTDIQPSDEEPAGPVEPIPTPEPTTQTLKLSANYYTTETKDEYLIVFTVLEALPAYTELGFKIAFSDAKVDSAAFDEALLTGAAKDILRGDDYAAYSLTRETAAGITAKSRLCTLTVTADTAPTAETLKITDFTLLKEDLGIVTITPDITLQAGPIVPELSETEQAAYDKLGALPNPAVVSFYQEDGSMTDIPGLSAQVTAAKSAYDGLSGTEKSNVQKVLEYNSLTLDYLTTLPKLVTAMNNTRGIIEIAYVLKDMKENTAQNYQFLAAVFDAKKDTVNLVGLPQDSTTRKECEETLSVLEIANTTINTTMADASEEKKTYACEDQIRVIQGLSKHKYYSEYLSNLKKQIKDLTADITKNYDGRNKEDLLDHLKDAATNVALIEEGADDLPSMDVGSIYYNNNYRVTFERKRTLANTQTATVTIVVTDDEGQEVDRETETFPNDTNKLEMVVAATQYPRDAKVTITAFYTLDGAEFEIGSITKTCNTAPAKKPIGILPDNNSSNTSGNDNNSSGGTIFPDQKEDPDDTKKPGDEADELFGDLAGYDWAKEAIAELYFAGIVNGMEENEFNPAGQVTREQFSKMVVQLFGVATGNTITAFVDVDKDAWYAPFVTAALQAGYIQGQSDDYFGIGESIMRQDMATILYRALGNSNSKAILDFSDTDDIAAYAEDAIAELVGLGVINGYEDGSFNPRGTATRAEAAKMIWGVYQILND